MMIHGGSSVLVDTNVISYIMRGDTRAKLYIPHLQGKLLAISFITVGEMFYGAEKKRWGDQKRKNLEATLGKFVVIPYDKEIAWCYARVVTARERKGRPINLHDSWIAACALRHGVAIVTHNASDFEDIPGLQIITEYQRP
jgi:predicted nucleic acid-binding protein